MQTSASPNHEKISLSIENRIGKLNNGIMNFTTTISSFSSSGFRPVWIGVLMFICSFGMAFGQVSKTNNTATSVDGGTATQSVTYVSGVDFPGGTTIADVDISITWDDGNPAFNLCDEIGFFLTSPSGTKVVLVYDAYNVHGRGATISANYTGFNAHPQVTVLFDQAAANIVGTPIGSDPVSGTFRPQVAVPADNLDNFNGETPFGNWTLTIIDGASGFGSVEFLSFTITISPAGAPCSLGSISANPSPQTQCEGETAVFGIETTGTVDSIQWFRAPGIPLSNGAGISGVNTDTLTLSNVVAPLNGTQYFARIYACSNPDSAQSASASLTVLPDDPPVINTDPSDVSACSGSPISFSVSATGLGLTYQWQQFVLGSFQDISGATSATYNSTAISLNNGRRYRCIVSGTCTPPDTSAEATLTVINSFTNMVSRSNVTGGCFQNASVNQTVDFSGATGGATIDSVVVSIEMSSEFSSCTPSGGAALNGEIGFEITNNTSGTTVDLIYDDQGIIAGSFVPSSYNNVTGAVNAVVTLTDNSNDTLTGGPTTGTFKSEGSLSTFIGENPEGIWTLRIVEAANLSNLIVHNWTVTIYYGGVAGACCAAPPVLETIFPDTNAHHIPVGSPVYAVFDSLMNAASVDTNTFAVHGNFRGYRQMVRSVSGDTVKMMPSVPFLPNEVVHVLLDSALRDDCGSAFGADFHWQFRAAAGVGPGNFVDSGQTLGSATSAYVAVGDLNGDGVPDALVANLSGAADVPYINNGSGTFTAGTGFGSTGSSHVALGDLDGDGDLDAFITLDGSVANKVWFNNGSGVFTDSGQSLGSSNSFGVDLADLDGDGDLDAFVSNLGQANRVWLNDGNGVFSMTANSLGSDNSYDAALGDFDGDGDIDAYVANRGSANKVWLNDGKANFTDSGQSLGSGNSNRADAGDLDGDGDLDIFVSNNINSANTVWLNNGSGVFTNSGQSLGSSNSESVVLGDVDGDGDLDAFIANANQADKLWLNNGSGTFTDSGQNMFLGTSIGVGLADFDGDSDLDAFVANFGGANKVCFNRNACDVTANGGITIDGSSFESEWDTLASKQNSNNGFNNGTELADILYYSTCDTLYLAIRSIATTAAADGVGVMLDLSGVTGASAGTNLGFNNGSAHYIGNTAAPNFQADFEVDYMFAWNSGASPTNMFVDVARVGTGTEFLGNAGQAGNPVLNGGGSVFGANTVRFAYDADTCLAAMEFAIPWSQLGGIQDSIRAFAFEVSATGFFSDQTIPGNASGNPGQNPNFGGISGGPFNSGFGGTGDNTAPSISCPSNQSVIVGGGCTAVSGSINPASVTDNCSSDTTWIMTGVTSGSGSGTFSATVNLGITTVQFITTDVSGNADSCTFSVTASDTTPPSISCPSNVVVAADAGCLRNVFGIAPTSVSDNCSSDTTYTMTGATTVSGSGDASSTAFNLGVTTLQYKSEDAAGNADSCSFTITVNDSTPPSISCPANVVLAANASCQAASGTHAPTSVSDNCSSDTTWTMTGATTGLGSGTFGGQTLNAGVTTITYTSTDGASNSANCAFTITVNDSTPPVITCPSNPTANAGASCTANVGPINPASVSDNCGSSDTTWTMTGATTGLGSGSFSGTLNLGNTTVQFKSTDLAGNSDSCSFTVTLVDVTPPIALCNNLTVQLDANGADTITASMVDNSSSDNCGSVTLSLSDSTFGCSGPSTTTLRVTDGAGLTDSCVATITVEDTLPPTVLCNDLTVYLDANGADTIITAMVNNGSTDNCAVTSLSLSDSTFDCNGIGGVAGAITTIQQLSGVQTFGGNPAVGQSFLATSSGVLTNFQVFCGNFSGAFMAYLYDGPNPAVATIVDSLPVTLSGVFGDTINIVFPSAPVLVGGNSYGVAVSGPGPQLVAEIGSSYTDGDALRNSGGWMTNTAVDLKFQAEIQGAPTPLMVTLTAMDAAGNTDSCMATITVSDTLDPVVTCMTDTVFVDGSGSATVDSAGVVASVSDNCSATVSFSPTSLNCNDVSGVDQSQTVSFFQAGGQIGVGQGFRAGKSGLMTGLTFTASYANATSPATVEVRAGSNPASGPVLASESIVLTPSPTPYVITFSVPFPVQQDSNYVFYITGYAGGIVAITQNGTGDPYPNGDFFQNISGSWNPNTNIDMAFKTLVTSLVPVTVTATDGSGNTGTCVANVLVLDTIPPSIVCPSDTTVADAGFFCAAFPSGLEPDSTGDNCGILGTSWVKSGASIGSGSGSVSGSQFNLGVTTVTYVVSDSSCNLDSCVFNVTAVDTTPPTAICQDLTVYIQSNDSVSIMTSDINNGSNDLCQLDSVFLDVYDFVCADSGANIVTLTAQDTSGNSSTCTATVTVQDTAGFCCQAPALVGGGNLDTLCVGSGLSLSLATTGDVDSLRWQISMNGGSSWSDLNDGMTNYSGTTTDSLTISNAPGSFDGNLYRALVYGCGSLTDSSTADTLRVDPVDPVAICQDITIQLDGSGNASITAGDIDNGSSDNCAIDTLTASITDFSCSNVGSNSVTLTATDSNGNSSTCTATVTVEDTLAPVITCPGDTTISTDTDSCNAAYNYPMPTFTDNCATAVDTTVGVGGIAIFGVVTDASDVYKLVLLEDIAANTVLHLTDNGWRASNSFRATEGTLSWTTTSALPAGTIITFTNDTPDIGTILNSTGSFSLSSSGDQIFIYQGSPASPNFITGIMTQGPWTVDATTSSNSALPAALTNGVNAMHFPSHFDNGQYDCSVTMGSMVGMAINDTANWSFSDPTITLSNCSFTIPTNTATPVLVSGPASGGLFSLGANTVTWTVADGNGNSDTCTFTVTVIDSTPPSAVCQDITIQLDAGGNASITANDIDNGSNDPCGIDSLSATPVSFTCSEVGANSVTLTATDNNGNSATCTATVTVEDTLPPVATCQDLTLQLDGSGNGSITANDVNNGSSDACGIDTVTVTPSSFNCTNAGANMVTLSVIDNNGNSASCTATVTVEDTIPPTAVCQDVTIQLDASGNASITAGDIDNGSNDACGIDSLAVSPTTFTCTNVGGNAVTLTVTDNNGNVSSCGATVTIEDTVPPVAVCQDVTVQLDGSGNTSITTGDINNGSSDACGIDTMTVTPNTFTCSNVGANTVTLTVTDNNGNSATCTASVTVADTIPPMAMCQDVTVFLDSGGDATVLPASVDNGSSDACGIASYVLDDSSFTCADLPSQSVMLTVTDSNGNSATCSATVTITDTINPSFSNCPGNQTVNTPPTLCGAIVSWVEPTANDNCPLDSLVRSHFPGELFPVGTTTVTYIAYGQGGLTDTCSFDVTVNDNTDPVINNCPGNIAVSNDAGQCGASVTWSQPIPTDNCPGVTLVSSHTPPSFFPIGTTTVEYIATDASGNSDTCAFTITVTDDEDPSVTCPPNVSAGVDAGMCSAAVAYLAPVANDNCVIDSLNQIAGLSSGASFPVGITTNTFVAIDTVGRSDTCSFTVTVTDDEAPVLSCPVDTVVGNDLGMCSYVYNYGTPTATDNCSLDSVFQISGLASGGTYPLGTSSISWVATDTSGNADTCTFTLTVNDTEPPVATCQNITVTLDASGNASITAGDVDGGSTDNCGILSLMASPTAFTCADIGMNPVALLVTDSAGNMDTCTATVMVQDTTSPTAVCQNITVQLDASGSATISAGMVDGGSTDVCGVANLSVAPDSFSCANVGMNTVTLTVTDSSGNSSTCTAMVMVQDTVPPIAVCQDVTVQLDAAGNGSITSGDINNGSSDNCGVDSTTVSPASFDCSHVGMNTVTPFRPRCEWKYRNLYRYSYG